MNKLNKAQMGELDALASKSRDGKLRAAEVERFARDPKTALHKRFEWSDEKAARLYRLDQARNVIQVYVEHAPGNGDVRGYISLAPDRVSGGGYTKLGDAMSDNVTRNMLIEQLRDDLRAVLKRHAHLRPIAPLMFDAIEALVATQARQGAVGVGQERQAPARQVANG